MQSTYENITWDPGSHVVVHKGSQGYSRVSSTDGSEHRLRFFSEAGEGSRVLTPDEVFLNWALEDFKASTRQNIIRVAQGESAHTYFLSTQ